MITIAICDDQKIIVQEVKKIVDEYYTQKKTVDYETKCFLSGDALMKEMCDYDVLFLDIEMPGMDGIEVGRKLLQMNKGGRIIMLTSIVERFQEAFEIEAFRFLTKSVKREEVFRALHDVSKYYDKMSEVELEKNGEVFHVKCQDILYLEAFGGMTEIYLKNTMFKSKKSLALWEEILDVHQFFRCHKKNIVNLSHIEKCGDEIVLETGEHILCSRRKKKELSDKLLQYDLDYRN